MRKHPLLAFAATTLGLSIGVTALGVSGASATPVTNHRLTNGDVKLVPHRGATGHQARFPQLGRAQTGRSVILSKRGPTDFLLPKSPRPRALASAPAEKNIWSMLRACESGNNYRENSGNGFYGAYQFTITSWIEVGEVGIPNLAPPAVQDEAAQRLLTIQGWHAWPMCSAMLGYA
ncbi:MAG TPA: transglycosylase family protein [Acidimicrobiales bacterium]|nr:transglycosylase family protein [Acidimicrobiales bacterium]